MDVIYNLLIFYIFYVLTKIKESTILALYNTPLIQTSTRH